MEFRAFLEDLKEEGELNEIDKKIDWELQSSAICAMSQRVGGPAVQFNNIKDYPDTSLVGSIFCGSGMFDWPQVPRKMHGRIAMGLGLEKDIHYDELLGTILDRKKSSIRPIEVESGPCQEVVIEGDDIDLYKYPIPYIHDKDGGRYLTSHVIMTRDEDRKWTNFETHRLMVLRRNKLVQGTLARMTRPGNLEMMAATAAKKGKPLPFAVVIGAPPEMMLEAHMNQPPEKDEYSAAGALGLTSIPLVKAKLSNILVPVGAEIVFEGHIYPGETATEGPYAHISYYSEEMENLVYRVECITQRKDPVFPFEVEGARPSDKMSMLSVMHSAEIFEYLQLCGVPVKWVTLPVEAKLCLAIVCLSSQILPGYPGRASELIYGMSPYARQVLVVDPDVDSEDLLKALMDRVFKANFERQYFISQKSDNPLGLTENHDFKSGTSSTLCIDATWRMDRPPETIPRRVTFEYCIPPDIQEKVIHDWNDELKLQPKVWKYDHKLMGMTDE